MNPFQDSFDYVRIFGNSLRQWSAAAILLGVTAAAFWFLRRFIRKRLLVAVGADSSNRSGGARLRRLAEHVS